MEFATWVHEIMQQIYIQPVQYQSARTWQLFQ